MSDNNVPYKKDSIFNTFYSLCFNLLKLLAMAKILQEAYNIRLYAVNEFGSVIHEFDPYFNFRAAEYLVANGWSKFINWYDEKSWYPLGRPVGTTIYPGLQILSASVYHLSSYFGWGFSLNDICVYQPAWFSIITCLFTFGIAYETSKSTTAGVFAAFIMAIVPAHIMRSVAGGYDNESIAIGAMVSTFYLWIRSLRDESSYLIGIFAALAYIFMVAAWGGYIFVLNMIGFHAFFLVIIGRYSKQLHLSYTIFYILGTLGAIQLPVVGLAPIKSLEQLGPMFVFFVLQIKFIMEYQYAKMKDESINKFRAFQIKLISVFIVALAISVAVLAPMGHFGPLSSRVRGLFVQHTRTGNPLVDSVAEHQATHSSAYAKFFQDLCFISPLGIVSLFWKRSDAKYFLLVYSLLAAYFSKKMNRLMLLLSPPASILAGIVLSGCLEWSLAQLAYIVTSEKKTEDPKDKPTSPVAENKKGSKTDKPKAVIPSKKTPNTFFGTITDGLTKIYDSKIVRNIRTLILAPLILLVLRSRLKGFYAHSHQMAEMLSNPSIIVKANYQDGRVVYLDDFREAYWWLRDHTPEDSRVMSWWDYGYQISQIANRTTLADGNTWNHEHIALLGKILVSNATVSHSIVRHLADYVLVWSTRFAGNPGDDIAKSPHMARISGSVYKDIKPNLFGMDNKGRPTKMMQDSLVYNAVLGGIDPNIPPFPPKTFKEAYTSSHKMVRIYKVLRVSKESKKYCAENRGYQSWKSGVGLENAYPPGLRDVLSGKQDFDQLEDFNVKKKG